MKDGGRQRLTKSNACPQSSFSWGVSVNGQLKLAFFGGRAGTRLAQPIAAALAFVFIFCQFELA
jgi:hypothetical protein